MSWDISVCVGEGGVQMAIQACWARDPLALLFMVQNKHVCCGLRWVF